MSKIIHFILFITLILSLSACNKDEENINNSTEPPVVENAMIETPDSDMTNEKAITEDNTTTTDSADGRQLVATVAEAPSGSTTSFTYDGKNAILINYNGDLKAFVNSCTHIGWPLELESEVIRCPWHNSEFDPISGQAIKWPATKALTEIEVVVENEQVFIK